MSLLEGGKTGPAMVSHPFTSCAETVTGQGCRQSLLSCEESVFITRNCRISLKPRVGHGGSTEGLRGVPSKKGCRH